jgi:RNase adapter protein RapZ
VGHEGARVRFVVLTGLSGAGRTTSLAALEDLGYFTADNVPPALWDALVAQADPVQPRVAVGVGVRTAAFLPKLNEALDALRARGIRPEIVFLDASNETLIRRYNFTRRTHPLGYAPLAQDIAQEREVLGELRAVADTVLDTSGLSARGLTEELWARFGDERKFRLRLASFGFKRGVPIDADNVFDLRSLPNPYYDPVLRSKGGLDPAVAAYVFTAEGMAFYTELREFVRLLASRALVTGRTSYTVAVGCTGGQHRSVAFAERLKHDLAETFATYAEHRDLALALAEHEALHG